MRRRAVRAMLIGLLTLAGALLACGGLSHLAVSRAEAQALAEAQARWQAHALTRYQLVVSEATGAGDCRQDVQIDHEQIVAVQRNQCVRMPSWTVSNLFTWVAGLNRSGLRCYPSNVTCVCHAVYSTSAQYDPQLGYPLAVTYRWHLQTNWAYWGHWERLLRARELPDCAAVSRRTAGFITITVLSLTPLP